MSEEQDYNIDIEPKGKVLYVIGCEWWANKHIDRLLEKDYGEYLVINKSIDGLSNYNMVNILKNDLPFFTSIKNPFIAIKFLVNFTEIGRHNKDTILPFKEVQDLVKNYDSYITTSFIDNTFNGNKRLIDFCKTKEKPNTAEPYSRFLEYIRV